MKTYEGLTLAEIKALHPNCKATYKRFMGLGDHGIEIGDTFYCDDYPMMNRHNKAEINKFTGTFANFDFSCEVFVDGKSHGTTSKHRARVYLKMLKKGINIDSSYRFADWRSVCEALELCGWTNCRQCAVRRSLFFVRWDLRILIRNENEKQKFKP